MQTTTEGVLAVDGESSAAPQLAQAAGESIGRVEAVQGNVSITRTDGTTVDAQSGTEIFQGDTVTTDAEGSIGLVFADNSTFSLAEGGEMVIDEMIYDPGTQEGNALFQVASGVFTFASGQIAKTGVDAMQIATPTATIGIRGTSGAVRIGKDGPDTYTLLADATARAEAGIKGQAADDVLLAQAPGGGTVGGMTVSNSVGSQTLTQINETTQISSPYSPPTRSIILPQSAVDQAFASARNVLPPPPVPTDAGGGDQGGGDQGGGDQTGGDPTGDPAAGPGQTDPDAAAEGGLEAGATPEGGPVEGGPVGPAGDAELAAADAFDEVLAGGGTLEDAMSAAAGAATQTEIQNALAQDPNVFGTPTAISSAMGGIIDNAMGSLGFDAGDPIDPGIGDGTAMDETSDEFNAAASQIFDTIVGASFDASQQAAQDNVFALVDDGLLSPLVAEGLASAFDSLSSEGFIQDFGGGFGGDFGGFGGFGGADAQLQQALFEQQFIEGFQEGLEQFTETFEEDLDDIIQDLPPAADVSVTINLSTGSDSYDFVNNQNDILISTDNDGNFSLTVGDQAQTGDFLEGGDANDFVSFASSSNNLSHVFAMKDVESITLPNVGSGNQFALNIQSAGTTTITLSDNGTNSIAGTPESGSSADLDQFWMFNDTSIGSSTGSLEMTGSTGNDTVWFSNSGNHTIAGMTGVEYVRHSGTNLTMQTNQSGVTFASSSGGTLQLGDGGNTVTIGQGGGHTSNVTWSAVTGGSGTDSVTVNATSGDTTTISSLSNVESLTGSGAGTTSVTLAAGDQTISAGGTFTTFGSGSGSDTVNLASSGTNSFSNVTNTSGTLTFVDGGGSSDTISITSGTAISVNLSGAFETVTGSGTTDTFTLASTSSNSLGNFNAGGSTVNATASSNDSVTFADGVNTTATFNGVEVITGGSGQDSINNTGSQTTTITGGASADTIHLGGTGTQIVRYTATSEGGDTLNSFAAGSGSADSVSFAAALLSNGSNSTTLEELTATNATVGANSIFVGLGGGSFTATNTNTAAGAAAVVDALDTSNIASGERVVFVMDNDTNSYVWLFTEDGSAGAQDDDMTLIATISSVSDAASFDDGDFSTF